jgi:dTDP-4-dehydrorhamnose 3,5-epimerase
MGLELVSEHLNGLKVFQPKVFSDERGFFMETYREDELANYGIKALFLQDNHSRSCKGVLRGMHFQWNKPQGKLIRVTLGSAYVVEVDIRKNSPTLGKWFAIELSAENKNILWVPPGFANGFLSISDWVEMQYKCTEIWNPKGESGILWNDPAINIDWQIKGPFLSDKDSKAQTLSQWLNKEESSRFVF